MKRIRSVAAILWLAGSVVGLQAELPVKRVLTLDAAKKIAAAAEAEAIRRGSTVVKARTAAIFRRPSKDFEDQIRNGRVAALALAGATPLQGGIPSVAGGKVIGAIGVSGNTPQEDEDIAKAGAAATGAAIGGRS